MLPTVKEVKEFLEDLPDDAQVWAYEGESGASINVAYWKPYKDFGHIYTNDD